MSLTHIKILPLLVVVAMLAFSVRLAEIVQGVSALPGAAMAAAEKKEAEAKEDAPKEDGEAAPHEPDQGELKPAEFKIEDDTASKPEDKQEADAKHGEAKPLTAEDKPPAVETPGWVDSEDSDTQFSTVRHELYDNLAQKREALDKREGEMVAREALMRAAEQEIDRKFNELSQLRQEIEKLLQKQSEEETARIASLVKIYEGMKPKDAARIFDTLDLDVLFSVMSKMSERKIGPIMAEMTSERAKTITIMLAEQKQLPQLPPVE